MKDLERLDIREADGKALIAAKVVPGSSRDRIIGVLGDALKIATSAPPEKNKANTAVAKMLAAALGVEAGCVRLLTGTTSLRKQFQIGNLSAEQMRERLSRSTAGR